MIGNIVKFLGERVAKRAVNTLERTLAWSAVGALFGIIALVFLMLAAYQYMAPLLGHPASAGLLGVFAAIIGVLAFFAPKIMDWLERQVAKPDEPVTMIEEEAHTAVDHFGPIQVGLSAFMLGVTAGRTVRNARRTKELRLS